MTRLATTFRAFMREEDGIALTEYLILLGLLVGGVIATVGIAGGNLEAAWASWAGFFDATAWDGSTGTTTVGGS